MTERPQPRRTAHRPALSAIALLGLGLAILSALAEALSGLGHRWGWWHYGTGFLILRWAATGGLIAAGLSMLGGFFGLLQRTGSRVVAAFLGVAVGFAVTGVPLSQMRMAQRVPPIHDITTDTEDPPKFRAILPLRKGAPNTAKYGGPAIAALQKKGYPDLAPARYALPPEEVFVRALAAARGMGWRIVAATLSEGRIEAVDRTFWFGFYDDVVIRIRREGSGARVDVRSLSRVGRSDVGANARRIKTFLKKLAEEMR
ncbi:MAG: DUF1499 domain-containing protein [bacterium]